METERLMKSESQKQLLSAKLAEAKAGDELDAMRTSLLGDRASTDDEDALGSRIEALEIELMELRVTQCPHHDSWVDCLRQISAHGGEPETCGDRT